MIFWHTCLTSVILIWCCSYVAATGRKSKRIKRHKYPLPLRDVTGQPSVNLLSPTIPPNISLSTAPSSSPWAIPSIRPTPSPSIPQQTNIPSLFTITSNHPSMSPSGLTTSLLPSSIPTIIGSKAPSLTPMQSFSSFPSFNPSAEPSQVLSSAPTSIPMRTTQPSNLSSCAVSPDERLIGNQTLDEIIVTYKYRMEFFANTSSTPIIREVEANINKELTNVSDFIECTSSGILTNLRAEKQSQVVGISSDPIDSISANESCPFVKELPSGIKCEVFDGSLTLFLHEESRRRLGDNDNEFAQVAFDIIKEKMNNHGLDSAHEAIVSLMIIDSLEDDIVVDDDNDGLSSNESNFSEGTIVPSYAWVLVAFGGGILLTGIIGVFHRSHQFERSGSGRISGLSSDDSLSGNNNLLVDDEDTNTIKTSNILQSSEGDISFSKNMTSSEEEDMMKKSPAFTDEGTIKFGNLMDSGSGASSDLETVVVDSKARICIEQMAIIDEKLKR